MRVKLARWLPILACLLLVTVGCLHAFAVYAARGRRSAAANPRVYDFRPGTVAGGAGPRRPLGSLAPDTALPTLESYLQIPTRNITTVRLAAYRGKSPVVLLLTGYT